MTHPSSKSAKYFKWTDARRRAVSNMIKASRLKAFMRHYELPVLHAAIAPSVKLEEASIGQNLNLKFVYTVACSIWEAQLLL